MLRMKSHTPVQFFGSSGYAPNDVGVWVKARELPWDVIGHPLGNEERNLTAAEALRLANLDITVKKWATKDEDGNPIPKFFVTGYDDPDTAERIYFAGVTDKYKVAQPADALTFFDDVVHARKGAHYSSVWNMREKSMMGVTIDFPDEIVIDPQGANDIVGLYGLGINSFDGSTGLAFYVSAVRFWCMNQLASMMRNAPRSVSFKHTAGVTNRVQEARLAIGVTLKWAEEFDITANALFEKEMTDRQFERLVKSIDGPNGFHLDGTESDLVKGRIEGRREQVMVAWRAEHNANITGTRWGAYNVLAEYAEWGRRVVGSKRTGTTAVRQRAIGTLVNWPTAFRYQVLQRLSAN